MPDESSLGAVPGGAFCGGMNETECAMFKAINDERASRGLAPLGLLSKCVNAAGSHAGDMAKRGYFSHDAPDETWAERMERFELSGGPVGENIAFGSTVEAAVTGWMKSSVHRANILSVTFRSTGVGYASRAGGERYWVQCFSNQVADL